MKPGVPENLEKALRHAAAAPLLLVACDFDGTLSGLQPRPSMARADESAMEQLVKLAATRQTHGAIVSGRGLADLKTIVGDLPGVQLVGSHGAEHPMVHMPENRELRDWLVRECKRLSEGWGGVELEIKPHGVAIHYARSEDDVSALLDAVRLGPGQAAGVHMLSGRMVLELSVVAPGKGDAIDRLRRRAAATCVLFVGDDITDEDAFESLAPGDVGIKVGPGDTLAQYRVADQSAVGLMLARLLELRTIHFVTGGPKSIERHSVLSDQRAVALIDDRARLVWMCAPKIDSGAMFAELVGGPGRGEFSVVVENPGPANQRYVGDTCVVETKLGGLTVTDYLDCSVGRAYQRAGRTDFIRVLSGEGVAELRFSPRFEFGRVPTLLVPGPMGLRLGGASELGCLVSPGVEWRIEKDGMHDSARATVRLNGEPLVLELRLGTVDTRPAVLSESSRRDATSRFWSGWSASLKVPDHYQDLIRRSAITLKALCHGPTGAIAAAATTSLPAPLGGPCNWDYRYCWPRDSAMSAMALLRLGNSGVAMKLLDWLVSVVERTGSPERLRPIYTVGGEELPPEAELSELTGYGGAKPVRVGNAAASQLQLDVFGCIVELVAMLAEAGGSITPQYWRLVEDMVRAVASRWEEPDCGIWEIRDFPKHHVHSKVMCWLAVDRGIAVAERVMGESPAAWCELRERIAADALKNGWNESVRAFTVAYGSDEADASTLMIGLSGLLPPDDPRWLSTLDFVQKKLMTRVGLRRYLYDDGLPGTTGAFHICTCWLIESLAMSGRRDEAAAMLDRYCRHAGPTGLIAEQSDPTTGLAMGNFPQAYSHLGLINCVTRLYGQRPNSG